MDGVKPWQLAVIIIGLVGGLGLVVWNFTGSKGPDTIHQMTLMDVEDGTLFVADLKANKTIGIPAKNPDTERRTLIPVAREGDTWFVPEYYRGLLDMFDNPKAITNASTGTVNAAAGKPKAYN